VDRSTNQLFAGLSQLPHAKAPSLHGHYPASSLLWASPTPPEAAESVIGSRSGFAPALTRRRRPGGLPGSWVSLMLTRRPRYPGKSRHCSRSSLHGGCWLRLIRQIGHSHLGVSRPYRGSLLLRLISSPSNASNGRSPSRPHGRLHV
jgi:hypothetical protein